jgi:hypothetical protein
MQMLYAELLERARVAVGKLSKLHPDFPFKIGWAASYEDVFSGRLGTPHDARAILETWPSNRRIVLTGRGGGGKTVILTRLARTSLEMQVLPVIIDLVNWTAQDNETWEACRTKDEEVMQFIFERFTAPRISSLELNLISGPYTPLVLIDGLSEVETRIGDSILKAVDGLLIALPGAGVIAADRLVRRAIDLTRWRIAALQPLSLEDVSSVLQEFPGPRGRFAELIPKQRALLTSPYYLHRFIQDPSRLAASTAAEQRRWFLDHASLSVAQLFETAAAAFTFYQRSHSRTFPLREFEAATSSEIVRNLREAGALVVDEARRLAYFDHQLKHDFLAAMYLASDVRAWGRNAFDIVTLHASSFDVLGLTLEQLENSGDEFVRRVYDWNPYGAAYLVAEDLERRSDKISAPMRLVMQGVMAERRFHLILATKEQAEDALRVTRTAEASEFLRAVSLEQIADVIRRSVFHEHPWFEQWKRVFTLPSGSRATTEDLVTIRDADSIIGWTYANVVKRLDLSSAQQATLREWMGDGNPEVRWRIAHAVGAFPSAENADFLFDALAMHDEDWRWVRYGATRSLVEMAARDQTGEVRSSIMNKCGARAEALLNDQPSLREFARSILIDPKAAPPDWAEQVKTVLVELYRLTVTSEAKERWLKLADEIDAKYVHAERR